LVPANPDVKAAMSLLDPDAATPLLLPEVDALPGPEAAEVPAAADPVPEEVTFRRGV